LKNKPLKPTKNLDTVAATDDGLAEVEDAIFLQQALSLLTSRQQKVIKATVREGRTEQEVAKELGVSQPAVHQMKERALNRLRKSLFEIR
jgi:RNA polymerase sigma-B factor